MTVTALITPATGSRRGLPPSSRQPIMYPESEFDRFLRAPPPRAGQPLSLGPYGGSQSPERVKPRRLIPTASGSASLPWSMIVALMAPVSSKIAFSPRAR
jgi:hypothetical protein